MRRLLILCEYPTLLGGERSMLATLSAISAAGFDVDVAAPPVGPLADALSKHGVRHSPWRTHDDLGVRLPLEQLRSTFDALLTAERPDLVHANSLSTTRIAGPVIAARRLASVGHLRDIVKLAPQAIADVNAHPRLLAVSRATCDFHVQQGVDATRCVVVHNGVDLSEFQPRAVTRYLHRELGLSPDARLIVTIGQLGLRKGMDVALAAARQLAADLPAVHWLVVGERTSSKRESQEFESLLHAIAGEPPLAGRVHFLGRRDDVPAILAECELLVHAARQEPLGRVLLEASASGLAVVATDVGGTREIFPSENDGAVLVSQDNRSALADTVRALLCDDSRRRALGSAGRRRTEQAFDVCHTSARLIEEYQLAMAGAG